MPDINGIPYVNASDLVASYPTVSQDLAQEISDQLVLKAALAGPTFTGTVTMPATTLIGSGATNIGNRWTTFTPVLSNTWTTGNGTSFSGYTKIGRTVHFWLQFELGSTTTIGASPMAIDFPVEAYANLQQIGAGVAIDASLGQIWNLIVRTASSTTMTLRLPGFASSKNNVGLPEQGGINTDNPFPWTTGDSFRISGTYESAS